MVTIRETTENDLSDIQRLWADGDVMRFVGFPEGLQQTVEEMERWYQRISAARPRVNHYSLFDDGVYCGESFYAIDADHGNAAALDIKLFSFARGKGIAAEALTHAMEQAFQNGASRVWVDPNPSNEKALALYTRLGFARKPMPSYLLQEETPTSVYMERTAY